MNTNLIFLDHFITHHPADATRILEHLKTDELILFLKELPDNLVGSIFNNLERFTAVNCLEHLGNEKAASILEKLPLQVTAVFLRRLKIETRQAVIQHLSKNISFQLKRILNFPEDSAGGLADPLVLTLPEDLSVMEAMERVQKRPEQAIYYLYIVNRQQALVGVVSIPELMLAERNEKLSTIMSKNISYLAADINFNAIINHPGWQDVHALPVVEDDMIFIGAIRYETLRQIERQSKKTSFSKQAIVASNALSELYQIGFSGLVKSATAPLQVQSSDKS